MAERYPIGRKVQVLEDYHDERYAGRFGTVAKVMVEDDRIYPHGRVAVSLVIDELYAAAFGGPPPKLVWFRPSDLERL